VVCDLEVRWAGQRSRGPPRQGCHSGPRSDVTNPSGRPARRVSWSRTGGRTGLMPAPRGIAVREDRRGPGGMPVRRPASCGEAVARLFADRVLVASGPTSRSPDSYLRAPVRRAGKAGSGAPAERAGSARSAAVHQPAGQRGRRRRAARGHCRPRVCVAGGWPLPWTTSRGACTRRCRARPGAPAEPDGADVRQDAVEHPRTVVTTSTTVRGCSSCGRGPPRRCVSGRPRVRTRPARPRAAAGATG
jgi:hypothetical protein